MRATQHRVRYARALITRTHTNPLRLCVLTVLASRTPAADSPRDFLLHPPQPHAPPLHPTTHLPPPHPRSRVAGEGLEHRHPFPHPCARRNIGCVRLAP